MPATRVMIQLGFWNLSDRPSLPTVRPPAVTALNEWNGGATLTSPPINVPVWYKAIRLAFTCIFTHYIQNEALHHIDVSGLCDARGVPHSMHVHRWLHPQTAHTAFSDCVTNDSISTLSPRDQQSPATRSPPRTLAEQSPPRQTGAR